MKVILELTALKLRAHDSVYWHQINKDFENLVKTCDVCQENSQRNNKDQAIPREVSMTPCSTVEMDLFTLDDQSFLLVVDVTPHFPVVRILSRQNCNSVIMLSREYTAILDYQNVL